MSNLKLPTLTVENLRKITKGKDMKIAHNTRVEWEGQQKVNIIYHNTVIATLDESGTGGFHKIVQVRTGGYSTMTTLARMHAVLVDNKVGYGASRRNWEAVIIRMDEKRSIVTNEGLSQGVRFVFNGNEYGAWSVPQLGF